MDILKWREGYETGISTMDEQHRVLIGLINNLYRIIRDKKGYDQLREVLQEMSKYGETHLQAEEELLGQYEYPGLGEQQDHHGNYLQNLKALLLKFENDKEATAQDIYIFLRQWWMEHITVIDKKYGPYLQEKGVF